MNKLCGIYIIKAILGSRTGWCYIGQSIDFERRKKTHIQTLENGSHANPKLSYYYKKYGPHCFEWIFLGSFKKESLDYLEKFFITSLNSLNEGFNCTQGGDGGPISTKTCVMQNMITGEVISTASIKEFAEKFNVAESSVGKVLKGKDNYVGDWFCPENKWRPKLHRVIDPHGQEYTTYFPTVFARQHNLETSGFNRMVRRELEFSQGWSRPDSVPFDKNTNICRSFQLINSKGRVVIGYNVSKFARQYKLNPPNLYALLHGRRNKCRDWSCVPD